MRESWRGERVGEERERVRESWKEKSESERESWRGETESVLERRERE